MHTKEELDRWKGWLSLIPDDLNYIIGGSIGLRHLRPIHDLDVALHPMCWERLLDSGRGELFPLPELKNVEFFRTSWPKGFGYNDTISWGEGIDVHDRYHKVWTLKQTLEWKRALGRPKDLADIELIEKSGCFIW